MLINNTILNQQYLGMTGIEWLFKILLLIFLLTVTYTDCKYHKIFNKHTYTYMLLGTILCCAFYGKEGFNSIGFSFGITLLITLPFYCIGWLSGGDVKMFLAASTLQNIWFLGGALLTGTILGAIYAMYKVIRTGNRKTRIPLAIFFLIGYIVYQGAIIYFIP